VHLPSLLKSVAENELGQGRLISRFAIAYNLFLSALLLIISPYSMSITAQPPFHLSIQAYSYPKILPIINWQQRFHTNSHFPPGTFPTM
jgi:hypothetical protein